MPDPGLLLVVWRRVSRDALAAPDSTRPAVLFRKNLSNAMCCQARPLLGKHACCISNCISDVQQTCGLECLDALCFGSTASSSSTDRSASQDDCDRHDLTGTQLSGSPPPRYLRWYLSAVADYWVLSSRITCIASTLCQMMSVTYNLCLF